MDYLRLGLFKIKERLGLVSYRLKLPNSIKKIYLVFYISLLEPALENAELAINIEIEETENEYKVEKILETKRISGRPHYLVK